MCKTRKLYAKVRVPSYGAQYNRILICLGLSDISSVHCDNPEFTVDYDYLVVGVGAVSNTFNTKGVEEYCHFLKNVEGNAN
jgi:NADH:ubiquinone reductase (non-electrogenic)